VEGPSIEVAPTVAASRARPGLRERTKARTRQELIDAAFALFAERGFESVTVDDIAERADVSPRTFFRYFPVKEDVALAGLQETSALLLERLAARPPEEPPLVALREAVREPLRRLAEHRETCAVLRLMGTCPSLLARDMGLRDCTEAAITRTLAERMGVDAGADRRPRLMAATFMAALGVTLRSWVESGRSEDLDARVDLFTRLLRDGFEPGG
jgi:AcrR family transcriptional regulator